MAIPAVVAEQIGKARIYLEERVGERYMEHLWDCLHRPEWFPFESPLETIFFAWYDAVRRAEVDAIIHGDDFGLATQQNVDVAGVTYRVDFVIVPHDYGEIKRKLAALKREAPKIAIEVDGHTFHEKTKEQVAARNQRDRLLQQVGWTVLHYSWSELTTDPVRCLTEVFDVASRAYGQIDTDHWTLTNYPPGR